MPSDKHSSNNHDKGEFTCHILSFTKSRKHIKSDNDIDMSDIE